jgi:hypothetical protein
MLVWSGLRQFEGEMWNAGQPYWGGASAGIAHDNRFAVTTEANRRRPIATWTRGRRYTHC